MEITYHHKVIEHDIPKLQGITRERIKNSIKQKLAVAPNIYGIPLRGTLAGYYKFKIGDYRVIYEKVEGGIFIIIIGNRKNVYEIIKRRI